VCVCVCVCVLVDLRRLRQTMRLAHWSVCPSQVAPMTWGSVDLDDSVHHRVCACVCGDALEHGEHGEAEVVEARDSAVRSDPVSVAYPTHLCPTLEPLSARPRRIQHHPAYIHIYSGDV